MRKQNDRSLVPDPKDIKVGRIFNLSWARKGAKFRVKEIYPAKKEVLVESTYNGTEYKTSFLSLRKRKNAKPPQ